MSWKSDDKHWTSKPFVGGSRKGTVTQHHILAVTVKKKPGRGRCVAKYGLRGRDQLVGAMEVKNGSRRPKTVWSCLQLDAPDSMNRKLIGRVGVKTNGNCQWRLRMWGPRKGEVGS